MTSRAEALRKEAQDRARIEHLTRVLNALRKLAQLMARAGDPKVLADRACELLVAERGYTAAWLHLGERGDPVHVAGAGDCGHLGDLRRRAATDWATVCLADAVAAKSPVHVSRSVACAACPRAFLAPDDSHTIVCPVRYEGQPLGALGVCVPAEIEVTEEEIDLVHAVSCDIALGLHVITAEAARREAEELYRRVGENVRDVVCLLDPDLTPRWFSPSIELLLGYTPDEVRSLDPRKVVTPESQRHATNLLLRTFGQPGDSTSEVRRVTLELQYVTKAGATGWLEARFSEVRGPDGARTGIVGSCHDITERRLDQRRRALETAVLRELEGLDDPTEALVAALEVLLAAGDVQAVGVWRRGLEGAARVALVGSPERDHRPARDPVGGGSAAAEPSCTEAGSVWTGSASTLPAALRAAEQPAGLEGLPYATDHESIVLVPLRVDGETTGVLQLSDSRPDRFDAHDVVTLETIARTIAEAVDRREGWAAALRSRELEAAVAATTVDFLTHADVQRSAETLLHHAVRLTGARFGAFVQQDGKGAVSLRAAGGEDAAELVSLEDPEGGWDRLDTDGTLPLDLDASSLTSVLASGAAIRVPPAAGGPISNIFACPMVSDGVVLGGLVLANHPRGFSESDEAVARSLANVGALCLRSAHNEEERQRAESQLITAQRMESVGRLAGGIAHDFNNLLTVIKSYTRFAMKKLRSGDPLRSDLEQVQGAAGRAASLTRQLLAFGRRQPLKPEPLDLNAVIKDLERMLERLIGEHIEVQTQLDEDLSLCLADQGQVEQVIMNLVVNARDAMAAGGTLVVRTAAVTVEPGTRSGRAGVPPGPYVMMAVTDSGTGMDQATVDQVFEPFFTTKPKGQGTGLGLSTVYGIVKQSGGHIEVASEPGRGTTFGVYLPVATASDGAARSLDSQPDVPSALCWETVLLVEDDGPVREISRRMLTEAGYRVLTAATGGEALRLCEGYPGAIHLLVTDVVMPGMGGPQLAGQLAGLRPGLPVVFVSGYADTAIGGGVMDSSAHFVAKPFSAEELLETVRAALDGGSPRPPASPDGVAPEAAP